MMTHMMMTKLSSLTSMIDSCLKQDPPMEGSVRVRTSLHLP